MKTNRNRISWGSILDKPKFFGKEGPQGIQGPKGDKGDKGDSGVAGSDATVTKEAVEAVLTGEVDSHSHAGGSGGLTQAQILTRQL